LPEAARDRLQQAMALGEGLRRRYRAGTVRGTFVIELPTPRAVRALALAGFDFVVLDLEHSPVGVGELGPLIAEAQLCGVAALVRPPALDAPLVGKLLDLGANGVLIPHVDSAQEARTAVQAARYAPEGTRGACPLTGTTVFDTPSGKLDSAALVLVQIESSQGLEAVDEIAATPGLDGVFVGPYDLSHALGEPGEVDGEGVLEASRRIALATPERVMLGAYVDDPAQSQRWTERGFRFQCVGFDGRMLLAEARATLRIACQAPEGVA
jgi:2-keto-3-deoxy-L-rhamnonate aldolase RhmA